MAPKPKSGKPKILGKSKIWKTQNPGNPNSRKSKIPKIQTLDTLILGNSRSGRIKIWETQNPGNTPKLYNYGRPSSQTVWGYGGSVNGRGQNWITEEKEKEEKTTC